jgi:hypothetical protein
MTRRDLIIRSAASVAGAIGVSSEREICSAGEVPMNATLTVQPKTTTTPRSRAERAERPATTAIGKLLSVAVVNLQHTRDRLSAMVAWLDARTAVPTSAAASNASDACDDDDDDDDNQAAVSWECFQATGAIDLLLAAIRPLRTLGRTATMDRETAAELAKAERAAAHVDHPNNPPGCELMLWHLDGAAAALGKITTALDRRDTSGSDPFFRMMAGAEYTARTMHTLISQLFEYGPSRELEAVRALQVR